MPNLNHPIQVAIDGLCGCGKSTLAKQIASKYHMMYIDSGALYSLTAYLVGVMRVYSMDEMTFLQEVKFAQDGSLLWKNKCCTDEIESPEVKSIVSNIAKNKSVRWNITQWIRSNAQNHAIAMDGRDIGSVVLPNADIKLYLFSSIEHRMKSWDRSQIEHIGFIDPIMREKVRTEMEKRDNDDLHREVAPLVCVPDALVFNMDHYSLQMVFETVCKRIDALLID